MPRLRRSFRTLFRILRGEQPWPPLRSPRDRSARLIRSPARLRPSMTAAPAEPSSPRFLDRNVVDLRAAIDGGAVHDRALVAPVGTARGKPFTREGGQVSRRPVNAKSAAPPIARSAKSGEGFATPDGAFATLRDTPIAIPQAAPATVRLSPGPTLPRDQEALLAIVRHRLLGYAQLQALLFDGAHRAVVGRRVQALEAAGWITRWEERVGRGGHPRYAVPTAAALRWARVLLLRRHAEDALAPLLATMLRDSRPEPLILSPGTLPPFLAHQRETNDLLIALTRACAPLLWSSSWHRPFPNEVRQLALPQPDAVIVLATAEGPRLLFLEHDRDHEPLGRFKEAKAERYAALAHDAATLRGLTGFTSFHVLVTVHAEEHLPRIAALQETVRATYGATMFSFTVGNWLVAQPTGAIWFDAHTPLAGASDAHPQPGLSLLPGLTPSDAFPPGGKLR